VIAVKPWVAHATAATVPTGRLLQPRLATDAPRRMFVHAGTVHPNRGWRGRRPASAEKLLGRDEPVDSDQRCPEPRVGGDELLSASFSECDVAQVVDWMVVVAASKIPRPVQVSWLVEKPHGQSAQQSLRGISRRSAPAFPAHASQQRVGDLLDQEPWASSSASSAVSRASTASAGSAGSAFGATQSTTTLASTTGTGVYFPRAVCAILDHEVSVEEEPHRALDRRMARTVRPLRRCYGSLLCNARGELGRALRERASHHRSEEWREQPHRSLRPQLGCGYKLCRSPVGSERERPVV